MFSRALLLWEMRRFRLWYAGFLLFFGIWLILLLLKLSSFASVHWENHPFLTFGIFGALFSGMSLFTRELQDGNIMEFLLARPVSRRELFNSLVLAWGAPLFLLMISPFLYALILSPWFASYIPLYRLAAADLLASAWVMAVFFASVFLGLVTAYNSGRYSRHIQAFLIGALVAAFTAAGIVKPEYWFNLDWQMQNHPWISLAASLALACLFYLLGLRRLERMDI